MDRKTQEAINQAGLIIDLALSNILECEGEFTDHDARVAILYARQDIAGVISLLTNAHHQLVMISRGVWLLVALVVLSVLTRLWH